MNSSTLNSSIHNLENGLSKMPVIIDKDANSYKLELFNNRLSIPINTDQITSLSLSKCNLLEIPPELITCTNLIEVDISHNKLTNVPNFVYVNSKIRTLNMSNNKLINFDTKPKCDKSLLYLNISYNRLENIPSWICNINCDELEVIKLSNNPFSLNTQLYGRYLKKLSLLELNNCNIKRNSNDRFLIEIPRLEKLFLSNIDQENYNSIQDLPFIDFACISSLKELHLIGLGISSIPDVFSDFVALELLNLKKNYISWFSDNFTQLINLRILIVSGNDLLSLPNDINKLKNLEKLLISDNIIGSLPSSIVELESLQTLDCYNNDFTENIVEIINKIPSLIAVDYEQNSFQTTAEDELYLKRRKTLRIENNFNDRINGQKLPVLTDESDSDCFERRSYSSCESENTSINAFDVNVNQEPENWDCESDHSIADDMNLVLLPYKFKLKHNVPKYKDVSDFIDPINFEDSPNDPYSY